jgi:hypothetical protein
MSFSGVDKVPRRTRRAGGGAQTHKSLKFIVKFLELD